ncbi:RAB6-interacting golgin-like [Teleopsis dalmanni]|uniref:RAB6-interacting golgin-like n=1 Tax=Teleopsis dalmanni TaxID=139649 RepID=UPI0018CE7754|nr:RAB6-interacting golgin-like [Teleopsis dalmanni]
MSEKFNGFSQDEINKVSGKKLNKNDGLKQAFRGPHTGIRRMPDKVTKPTITTKKQQQAYKKTTLTKNDAEIEQNEDVVNINNVEDDTDNISAMPKISKDNMFYPIIKSVAALHKREALNGVKSESASHPNDLPDENVITSTSNAVENCSETTPPLVVESAFKGVSLKDFESHRKLIQEQNNQKKELLRKAIEQHSQKTAAETKKIEEIKSELSKLDNDLAVDVAILRKQIDNACIHFANVEKQYIKIEAQFLKSKIDLHNAAEKKELLTEHLCTVIAHNEDRKAQKLSELMEKVGITPTGEYEPTSTTNDIDK